MEDTSSNEYLKRSVLHGALVDRLPIDSINSPLHYAMLFGSPIPIVQLLIEKGASIDDKNNSEESVFHFAAKYHPSDEIFRFFDEQSYDSVSMELHTSITKMVPIRGLENLISRGCDVNQNFDYKDTLLHTAASSGVPFETFEWLVQQGLDIHAVNKFDETVLDYAISCLQHPKEIVKFLYDKQVKLHKDDWDDNKSLLHLAIKYRWPIEMLEFLVDRGEDLNAVDATKHTLLHEAAGYSDDIQVLLWLLDRGADVNAKARIGGTPLEAALGHCHPDHNVKESKEFQDQIVMDKVLLLIDRGADVCHVDRWDKNLFAYAVEYNRPIKLLELIISYGVDIFNISTKSPVGGSALTEAIEYVVDYELFHFLLVEKGLTVTGHDFRLACRNLDRQMPTLKLIFDHFRGDVNEPNEDGNTALHYIGFHHFAPDCSSDVRIEKMKMLVERGANLNVTDNIGRTPLHCCAMSRDQVSILPAIEYLVEKGADVMAVNKNGWTVLHYVSCQLYQYTAKGDPVVIMPYVEYVQYFIDSGVDVCAATAEGDTALHFCVNASSTSKCSQIEVATVLLDHGADINAVNKRGQTPLHSALDFRSWEKNVELFDMKRKVMSFLIERGADVGKADGSGRTPLHYTFKYSSFHGLCRIFLEKGGDVNAQDLNGNSVLHYAAKYGADMDTWRILIDDYCGNLKVANRRDKTPLHVLLSNDRFKRTSGIVNYFIEKGVDINAADDKKRTCFHYVLLYDRGNKMIKLFLESGADLNAMDEDGDSVLRYAAYVDDIEVWQLMMDKGGDVKAKNATGKTVVHYVADDVVIQFLKKLNLEEVDEITSSDSEDSSTCTSDDEFEDEVERAQRIKEKEETTPSVKEEDEKSDDSYFQIFTQDRFC